MTGTALNLSRREALGTSLGFIGGLVLPRLDTLALEIPYSQIKDPLDQLYTLRNPQKAYNAFKALNQDAQNFPPFEQFHEALNVSRNATCAIYLLRDGKVSSTVSGFLIDLPQSALTDRARNKRYVVTCDHMRLDNRDGMAQISFPDGTIVKPERQLIEKMGAHGFPSKDLRIYECSDSLLRGNKGLPCRRLADEVSLDSFALTYEPLNLRVGTSYSANSSGPTVVRFNDQKLPLEQFIVSKITNTTAWQGQPDTNYPANSGFSLDGYLNVGGSGAPAILFAKDAYSVAGLQVSFVPEPTSEHTFALEIRNDARIVHINNVLDLLKVYSIIQ